MANGKDVKAIVAGLKALSATDVKKQGDGEDEAVLPGLKKLPVTDPAKQSEVDEEEASNKSWASVDKAKLPAACFLWVEDAEKKSTWHLPYREGTGDINPETGMYSKAGAINLGAVRAIMAALGGARSGKAMSVPDAVKAKAEALAKRFKIGSYAEAQEAIEEAFVALGDALEDAVAQRWPDRYILYDFSNEDAILRVCPKPMNPGDAMNDDYEKYYRVGYQLTDDEIKFDGEPVEVRQVVDYV